METKLIDHLFRHHSGKMVSVLTRFFGLEHLEIIEDAVQDTFIKASLSWRTKQPENPEAWLTKAAKNRVLDIFRKLKTAQKHLPNIITLLNLFCGCCALVSVLNEQFITAFFLLLAAGIADYSDGMLARVLKVNSPLGKELDSLADMVSFGVVPGAIIYILLIIGGATLFLISLVAIYYFYK